jgi:AraC-like DNA-binding protein
MRKTLLMVGAWDGAARLVNSAVGSGWRVVHTLSCDDASEAVDEIHPNIVLLCGSDAVAHWRRATTPPARLEPVGAARPRRAPHHSIRAALEFIDLNHAEPITLDDAARVATYSRCHFSKTFKEQVGMGFVAYLTSVRVAHAKRLLSNLRRRLLRLRPRPRRPIPPPPMR